MEYHIYFENSFGKETFLDTIITEENVDMEKSILKCLERIDKFLKSKNYKSYYQRWWFEGDKNKIIVDVGSHSEFFNIYYNKIQQSKKR